MSTIDTTTSIVTLRTNLGIGITTEQLRNTIDAALTLVQYAADSLVASRYHHTHFDPAALSRHFLQGFTPDAYFVQTADPGGARDLAADLTRSAGGARDLAAALALAADLARSADLARDLDLAADLGLVLARDLDLAADTAQGIADGMAVATGLAVGYVFAQVAEMLNNLAGVLNAAEIDDQELEVSFKRVVDRLVHTRVFKSAPSGFTGVLALSYRNPLEIVIDVDQLVHTGVTVGGVLGGLRILFGSGPGERNEARFKKAEARVKNTEAERNQLEIERLRRDFEDAVGHTGAPIDERVENAASAVWQNNWIVELD